MATAIDLNFEPRGWESESETTLWMELGAGKRFIEMKVVEDDGWYHAEIYDADETVYVGAFPTRAAAKRKAEYQARRRLIGAA